LAWVVRTTAEVAAWAPNDQRHLLGSSSQLLEVSRHGFDATMIEAEASVGCLSRLAPLSSLASLEMLLEAKATTAAMEMTVDLWRKRIATFSVAACAMQGVVKELFGYCQRAA